jgi:hypothetical protein
MERTASMTSDIVTTKPKASELAALEPIRSDIRLVHAMREEIVKRYTVQLQGKRYLTVAGQTLIANGLGYCVREVSVLRVEIPGCGFAWEATCEVLDVETNTVVGRGSGIVSDDEKPWGSRPQFARRAMACTRAAGRALRLTLGHLYMQIGDGIQPTAVEEMPHDV